MKKLLKSLAVLAISITTAGVVYGVNNIPDGFEISVTPLINYSVVIATPSGGIVFDSTGLDIAYVNASSVTITNNGNIPADWTLKATALTSGGWTLGTALANNGSNSMVLAAIFQSTSTSISDYNDGDVLLIDEKGPNLSHFAGIDQNGDNVEVGASKLLWIYVKTPSATTVDAVQKFRIDVKAYPSNTIF